MRPSAVRGLMFDGGQTIAHIQRGLFWFVRADYFAKQTASNGRLESPIHKLIRLEKLDKEIGIKSSLLRIYTQLLNFIV